jgi:hypothetical protein
MNFRLMEHVRFAMATIVVLMIAKAIIRMSPKTSHYAEDF